MSRVRKQAGFTMVELAFAGLIAVGLTMVALELLLQSASVRMEMEGRIRANQTARQTLSLLANGGNAAPGAGLGADGGGFAHGIRGRNGPPAVAMIDGEVLQITSNGLDVKGDRASPIEVVCTGPGEPHVGCADVGSVLTLDGAVPSTPIFNDNTRSVFDRTVEVEITVQDPWAAARGQGAEETYGGIYIYNAKEGEGTPGDASGAIGK